MVFESPYFQFICDDWRDIWNDIHEPKSKVDEWMQTHRSQTKDWSKVSETINFEEI
jgi:hypothetical protein